MSSSELTDFASGLRFDDLPAEVIEKAKGLILDSVGIQLAASTTPWCQAVHQYVVEVESTPGPCTLVASGIRVRPGAAALYNGICAHGFELDEMQPGAGVHCGCVIVPTALAMAEHENASGEDLLVWVVLGFEVMTRIGLSCSPTMLVRGHHGTGAVGSIASAAVAGVALRLSPDRLVSAIGIGAFQAAGLLEGTISGGELKRLSGGMGAANGIRAALLAQHGLGAPASMIDGDLGFGRAFSDDFRVEEVTRDLGTKWHILDSRYKWYAQDGFIQPMTQAIDELLRRQPIDVAEIDEIVIGTNKFATKITGTIREPQDVTGAQFSAPFSVALRLVKGGAGFADYTEANLRDPEVRALSARVRLVVDDALDKKLMFARGASLEIKLRNGQRHTQRVDMLAELDPAGLREKYRKLATVVLDSSRAEHLAEDILSTEKLPAASSITSQMTRAVAEGT
jgi:2-methylcitrate dehydratase PrpD